MGLCRRVWDRGSGTATLEPCAIGLGRVEGHGSTHRGVGYISLCQDDYVLPLGWAGRVGALTRDEVEVRVEDVGPSADLRGALSLVEALFGLCG